MYSRRASDSSVPASVIAARLAKFETQRQEVLVANANRTQQDPFSSTSTNGAAGGGHVPAFRITIWQIAQWLWAGWRAVVAMLVVGALAGFLFSQLVPPKYTSYVDLIVGLPDTEILPRTATGTSTRDAQLLEVDSRLRMLTSTNVLSRAVEALHLDTDPEFAKAPGLLAGLFGGGKNEDDAGLSATRNLYEKVSAWRDDQSYVITLEVSTEDAKKSVKVAGAITESFQKELWAADQQESEQAVEALRARLSEMGNKVHEAEEAVETFRRENGLQNTDGQLLSNQSLNQFNTQLNDARTALIDAQSRQAKLAAGKWSTLAGIGSADTQTMASLREDYYAVQREMQSLSAIYGPRHPSIAKLEPELEAARKALEQEYSQLKASAAADVSRAQAVIDKLTAQVQSTRESVSDADTSLIQLRALQREAETQTTIYGTYLSRLSEISERGQMKITTMRVISPALPATSRSWPPRALILLPTGAILGAMLGLALAVALGVWRAFWPDVRRNLVPQKAPDPTAAPKKTPNRTDTPQRAQNKTPPPQKPQDRTVAPKPAGRVAAPAKPAIRAAAPQRPPVRDTVPQGAPNRSAVPAKTRPARLPPQKAKT